MLSDDVLFDDDAGDENDNVMGTDIGSNNHRFGSDKTTSFNFNNSGVYGDGNKSPMSKHNMHFNGNTNDNEFLEKKVQKAEENELEDDFFYEGDPWIYDGTPITINDKNTR